MKMKKAVALLCTAGILMGMLSGCGNSDSDSSNTQSQTGGHPALVQVTVKAPPELLMAKLNRSA